MDPKGDSLQFRLKSYEGPQKSRVPFRKRPPIDKTSRLLKCNRLQHYIEIGGGGPNHQLSGSMRCQAETKQAATIRLWVQLQHKIKINLHAKKNSFMTIKLELNSSRIRTRDTQNANFHNLYSLDLKNCSNHFEDPHNSPI